MNSITDTYLTEADKPLAIFAGEIDFQRRITEWDLERLEAFLTVKQRDVELFGGDDFVVRALRWEIAHR